MSSQKRKVPENGDVSRKTARCSAQQVAAILESDDEETLGFDEDYPSDELKTDSDDNVENDNDSESDSDNENPVDRLPVRPFIGHNLHSGWNKKYVGVNPRVNKHLGTITDIPPTKWHCPDTFLQYENDCYYFSSKEETYEDSKNFCNSYGTTLVNINNELDYYLLGEEMSNIFPGINFWIGTVYNYTNNAYISMNDTMEIYYNFAAPEPNFDENVCAVLSKHVRYKWYFQNCENETYQFICFKPGCSGSNCYTFMPIKKTFNDAAHECNKVGLKLLPIKSVAQQKEAETIIQSRSVDEIWVGIRKPRFRNFELLYSDNSVSAYALGFPTPTMSTDGCMKINNTGLIVSDKCDEQNKFVCGLTFDKIYCLIFGMRNDLNVCNVLEVKKSTLELQRPEYRMLPTKHVDTCHYSYRVKMASSNARYDNVDNVSDTLSSSSEISEDEIDLSSCEDYCEEIGGWGKCVEPYKFQPLKSVSEDRYTSVSNSPF
ncbi:NKG2-C type II integral membrane protein [Nymphon striatum]|nr:NKG2-C type II integral membrane protein [Nymphon striatum]